MAKFNEIICEYSTRNIHKRSKFMHVSELNIKNYRKFQNYNVILDKRLSVLIGKNGTGKTSILEALTVAIGTFFLGIDGVSSVGIKPNDANNKYFVLGEDVDVQKQFPVEISAKGDVDGLEIEWSRMLNSLGGKTTYVCAKDMTHISTQYQKRLMKGDQTLILPVLAYYGTGRLWDDHREKWSEKFKENTRINGYIDCLDGRANIKLLLDWFRRMSIKSVNNRNPNETYIAVKTAMERCFTRLTGVKDVSVLVNPDTFVIEVNYYTDEAGRVQIPLEQLSDGYRCALSLIGDIAYRMATLNPQLKQDVLTETPGIILIDEVDLHLHPEWQQHILKDLTDTFPKVQFIVTTHAPAIINSTDECSLLVLEENNVEYLGNEAYGQDINTIVKSYMAADVRPIEIQQRFDEFYSLLDENKIQEAKEILTDLKGKIDVNDYELTSCIIKIKLAEHRVNK